METLLISSTQTFRRMAAAAATVIPPRPLTHRALVLSFDDYDRDANVSDREFQRTLKSYEEYFAISSRLEQLHPRGYFHPEIVRAIARGVKRAIGIDRFNTNFSVFLFNLPKVCGYSSESGFPLEDSDGARRVESVSTWLHSFSQITMNVFGESTHHIADEEKHISVERSCELVRLALHPVDETCGVTTATFSTPFRIGDAEFARQYPNATFVDFAKTLTMCPKFKKVVFGFEMMYRTRVGAATRESAARDLGEALKILASHAEIVWFTNSPEYTLGDAFKTRPHVLDAHLADVLQTCEFSTKLREVRSERCEYPPHALPPSVEYLEHVYGNGSYRNENPEVNWFLWECARRLPLLKKLRICPRFSRDADANLGPVEKVCTIPSLRLKFFECTLTERNGWYVNRPPVASLARIATVACDVLFVWFPSGTDRSLDYATAFANAFERNDTTTRVLLRYDTVIVTLNGSKSHGIVDVDVDDDVVFDENDDVVYVDASNDERMELMETNAHLRHRNFPNGAQHDAHERINAVVRRNAMRLASERLAVATTSSPFATDELRALFVGKDGLRMKMMEFLLP